VPSPLIPPKAYVKGNAFTYLFTPQFKVSPDFMVYARLASGYRPGGANVNNTVHGLPSFDPDTTKNYEIGAKSDFLDHKLSFDASVYYIDWKDIQLQVIDPTTKSALYINGSTAKSQGVEFSTQARPLNGLSVSAWVAYDDAELTRALPLGLPGTAIGATGERLPNSSRYSGQLSLDQEFALTGRLSGFVGGSVSYIGDRKGIFTRTDIRADLPAYVKIDLRAGVTIASWKADFYVNNMADKRGVASLASPVNPNTFFIVPPRTLGLNMSRSF
jgi:outer membrane receptor protein involved in Fe transport